MTGRRKTLNPEDVKPCPFCASKSISVCHSEVIKRRDKNSTDTEFEDMEKEGENIKVVLKYIGEGLSGEYNEDDAEDSPLLRFDLYVKDEDGAFSDEPEESRCTLLPATIEREAAQAALDILFERFSGEKGCESYKHLADELSYMDEDVVLRSMKKKMVFGKENIEIFKVEKYLRCEVLNDYFFNGETWYQLKRIDTQEVFVSPTVFWQEIIDVTKEDIRCCDELVVNDDRDSL